MRILALSAWDDVKVVAGHMPLVSETFLRAAETGLVMLRGRMGGTGSTFNLGEATVTRCSVKIAQTTIGHAYVMGRNHEHARIAALCDALLQMPEHCAHIEEHIIQPLLKTHAGKAQLAAQKAAATKVDFFTLVRGDG
jgi:alpha-D-ribose 1-methylphosphonate 5-triphosphate synthase subunit PhnG